MRGLTVEERALLEECDGVEVDADADVEMTDAEETICECLVTRGLLRRVADANGDPTAIRTPPPRRSRPATGARC